MCNCFIYQIHQQFTFHDKYLHIAVVISRMSWLNFDVLNISVIFNINISTILIPFHRRILGIHQGDVSIRIMIEIH